METKWITRDSVEKKLQRNNSKLVKLASKEAKAVIMLQKAQEKYEAIKHQVWGIEQTNSGLRGHLSQMDEKGSYRLQVATGR